MAFFYPIWQGIGGGLIREGRLLKNSPFKGGLNRIIMVYAGFLLGIFSGGGGAKSIAMQSSFVMLLFSDQNSARGKSFQGGKESQYEITDYTVTQCS